MRLGFWLAAIVLVFLDRLVKWIVIRTGLLWQMGFLKISVVYNNGIAFGLLSNWPSWVLIVINFLLILVLLSVLLGIKRGQAPVLIGGTLIFSGAIGNFIDRLFVGSVVDYIHLGRFPVFNLADAMISLGVAVILLGEFGMISKKK